MEWWLDQLGLFSPFLFAAFALRIEFLGLVDLVSDIPASPHPQAPLARARILLPNAVMAGAAPVPPDLQFDSVHRARIVIEQGTVHSDAGLSKTTWPSDQTNNGADKTAYSLEGLEFQVDFPQPSLAITADRSGTTSDGQNPTSLNYLAQMKALIAQMATDGHLPAYRQVEWDLLDQWVDPDDGKLISRMVVTGGHLKVSELWTDENGRVNPIRFGVTPAAGMIPVYEAYLAKSFFLSVNDLEGEQVTLSFRDLKTGTAKADLKLLPEDDGTGNKVVYLSVKNLEPDDDKAGPHFIGHYFLRDGWEDIEHARFPESFTHLNRAFDDPQCSPADNEWP